MTRTAYAANEEIVAFRAARPQMRATGADGTVLVDHGDQADVTSRPFDVYELRAARWLAYASAADSITAGAEHPAGGLPRVRRTLHWSPGVLIILDEILGCGEHEVAVQFRTAAVRWTGAAERLRLQIDDGSEDSFWPSDSRATPRAGGSEESSPVFWSPRYEALVPATRVEILAGRRRFPDSIVTMTEVLSSVAGPDRLPVDRDGQSIRVTVEGVELGSLRLAEPDAGEEV